MRNKLLKGRNLIRISTFILAGFAVLGGFTAIKCRESKIYRLHIENTYQHSLDELCSSIQNISVSLEKAIYATTASQLSTISSEIMKESTTAKSNLSALPSSGETLNNINRFLTQAGDYSAAMAKKIIANEGISEDERTNIINLQKSSSNLNAALNDLAAYYEEGGKWSAEATSMLNKIDFQSVFGQSTSEMENTFTSYPSLLYDGPFSDHILKAKPQLLEGKKEITQNEAHKAAALFIEAEENELEADGEENGNIQCYRFKGDNTTISVTKKGGYVSYYRKYRPIGNDGITYQQAIDNALAFVARFDNAAFKESYYFTDEGMCTVNLAYTQGNTICYTDLIKIGVAMDNGEIIMFESTGYIMNHTTRTISSPKYTEQEAQKLLSPKLKLISTKDVLIPSPGTLSEYHCYEFYCTGINDREYLIYIDSDTLQERDIQLVLRSDGGTMTK